MKETLKTQPHDSVCECCEQKKPVQFRSLFHEYQCEQCYENLLEKRDKV
jgi:hypothetical protein